ncbi:VOC family protein [Leucobacter sp. HY1910]
MSRKIRFDHVGITVRDLDAATAFFESLGLEVEGRTFVEGDFIDTVTGIDGARSEIVMLRLPEGGATVELSRFVRPAPEPGLEPEAESAAPMATDPGIRSVAFEVSDVRAQIARLAADGFHLVGGVGDYEGVWRMAYVRGPEGIIVALAERL